MLKRRTIDSPRLRFAGRPSLPQAGKRVKKEIANIEFPMLNIEGLRYSVFSIHYSIFNNPLSAEGEERVAQRSERRVSKNYIPLPPYEYVTEKQIRQHNF
jgi:hypothetical protein